MRESLLKLPEVSRALGRSAWCVYADVRRGVLTKPVRVSRRASLWPASEIEALIRARVAGASEPEVRALVDRLHAKRKTPPGIEPGGVIARNERGRFSASGSPELPAVGGAHR